MSLPLNLYRLGTGLAEPFAQRLLNDRLKDGKEDPERIGERLGHASRERPYGRLVWIHGASVGESLSHLPLVERWMRQRPDVALLVTSGTRTAAELLEKRLPHKVAHQYLPIDTPKAVRRFLNYWRPELGIFVESELWPNLLWEAHDSGARLALLGARLSDDSRKAWDRAPGVAKEILGLFELIYAQDEQTMEWIVRHGAAVAGRLDLKRLAAPLPCNEAELEWLRASLIGRKVVVAASTHPGEESIIAQAVRTAGGPRTLLIVVPRHPERGADVAAELQAAGWVVARRSRAEAISAKTEAYVADTVGELGLFFRLANAVVMGGSFIDGLSGHNPLEPARLAKALISGPYTEAHAETYAELVAEKAALVARTPDELARGLKILISEPAVAKALGERARQTCARGGDAFNLAWRALQWLLPEP